MVSLDIGKDSRAAGGAWMSLSRGGKYGAFWLLVRERRNRLD